MYIQNGITSFIYCDHEKLDMDNNKWGIKELVLFDDACTLCSIFQLRCENFK